MAVSAPIERLRVAIVGGGQGSVIGNSHRLALHLSERYQLVASAFDIDPDRGRNFAALHLIGPDRAYADADSLIAGEAQRDDKPDLVCVLTPNSTHFDIAGKLVDAGYNVMCEKPMTTRIEDAVALEKMAADRGVVFAVMYGYTGYPMVRYARDLISSGKLGGVRLVQSEFALGTPSTLAEDPSGHWRTKPVLSGESAVVGMVGTHALYLSTFMTGLKLEELAADFRTFVPGRQLEDNANILLRFSQGATGMMWNSYVAAGVENGLRVRIFCEKGGVDWIHERPNQLELLLPGEPNQVLTLASRPALPGTEAVPIAAVQPEGFIEAFSNIYRDVADAIIARKRGEVGPYFPNEADGAIGVKFVAAAVQSSRNNAAWTPL